MAGFKRVVALALAVALLAAVASFAQGVGGGVPGAAPPGPADPRAPTTGNPALAHPPDGPPRQNEQPSPPSSAPGARGSRSLPRSLTGAFLEPAMEDDPLSSGRKDGFRSPPSPPGAGGDPAGIGRRPPETITDPNEAYRRWRAGLDSKPWEGDLHSRESEAAPGSDRAAPKGTSNPWREFMLADAPAVNYAADPEFGSAAVPPEPPNTRSYQSQVLLIALGAAAFVAVLWRQWRSASPDASARMIRQSVFGAGAPAPPPAACPGPPRTGRDGSHGLPGG